MEFAEFNETLVFMVRVKYHNDSTAFTIPLGKDIHGCFREIELYCKSAGIPFRFCTVTREELPLLASVYGDIKVHQEKSWSDYIYRAEDITTLAGRRFSGQRNHINYFKKTFEDYTFEEICGENLNEVKIFYDAYNLTVSKPSAIFTEEKEKTIEVLNNYDTYGLFGGLLRVNGSVSAFSIGETIGNVLFVHIEKADMSIRGAYQVINNEFARHFVSNDTEFINREEDVGDDGLRTSKLAYHPIEIIDKFIVTVE